MVLEVKMKAPEWSKMKISRVVLISGLLTFLYLIEFSIGIRTVYYAFSLWNTETYVSSKTPMVSWTLCVACLLISVSSSFTINLLSAMWEQKQIKETGNQKSAIRFAFHIAVGGMIWRYICLWFSDSKELQKKESLLLTITKFLFTQFFTIPMIIVHASLMDNFDEIIYIVCSVLCVSVNLISTCTVFFWCKNEVKELKKWNYETLDLVPLIFCPSSVNSQTPSEVEHKNETSPNKEVENVQNVSSELKENTVENALLRMLILLQTFGFTFGRLLALGILLKLAGIYAVSILFLQLLISVVYLKFQVPFLVSDSLAKWRQLTRLAFMSYILIFEWHLNRDPKTGYDFTSNTKHSLIYYCIATVECVFYFIAWAITDSYVSDYMLDEMTGGKHYLTRNIVIVGTLSLVFSLIVYFVLTFWQTRRLSTLMHSIRRRYMNTKLEMTNRVRNKCRKPKPEADSKVSHLNISNPIKVDSMNDDNLEEESNSGLEKHSSYKDLREPLDDEIEIFVGKTCDEGEHTSYTEKITEELQQRSVTNKENFQTNPCVQLKLAEDCGKGLNNENYKSDESDEQSPSTQEQLVFRKNATIIDDNETMESNENKSKEPNSETVTKRNGINSVKTEASVNETQPPEQIQLKSKITQFSESITDGWNKFSVLSKRFTGTMRDQIVKRKEQFQSEKSNPSIINNKIDTGQKEKPSPENHENAESDACTPKEPSLRKPTEDISHDDESSEGYFIGDVRCNERQRFHSEEDDKDHERDIEFNQVNRKKLHSSPEIDVHSDISETETIHHIGDEPCPCFVCKHVGGGTSFLRRRSSVSAVDRKVQFDLERLSKENNTASYPSSPTAVHVNIRQSTESETDFKCKIATVPVTAMTQPNADVQKLSFSPSVKRVEHFV